uniref:Uncharacterized protein n=1 Tax=Tanacetum cinerariifolium TaxID=118510 RepID=A0A6L2KEL8_TANCI|nr:hypothetical protein [Tanacetum cinerariifolium]
MDTFLKLLVWTETIVRKGDPIPDNQCPKVGCRESDPREESLQKNLEKPNSKIIAAREKKDQQNLAKAQTKCVGEGGPEAPRKKRRNARHPLTVVLNDAARAAANIKKEVVDLSGNTRVTTSPATVNQPSPRLEHDDTHEHTTFDDTEEGMIDCRFVPNWGLRDDILICTFRACKELISHLATSAKKEFLGNLTNVKVVSRAYQSLRQCVMLRGELLKRHGHLNYDYVDLCNRSDAHLMELDRLRTDLQREMVKDLEKERDDLRQTASDQVERIKDLEEALKLKSVQMAMAEGKVKVLEDKKDFWPSKASQALHHVVSLCLKVVASYHLSVDGLMKVSPDVPPPPQIDGVETIENDTGDATWKSPQAAQETTTDTPFGTTT